MINNSLYEGFFENSPLASVVIDPVKHNIIRGNQAFYEFLGYENNSLEGALTKKIITSDTEKKINKIKSKGEIKNARFEIKFIKKDQSEISCEVAANLFYVNKDLYVCFMLLNHNQNKKSIEHKDYLSQETLDNIPSPMLAADYTGIIEALNKYDVSDEEKLIKLAERDPARIHDIYKKIKVICVNKALMKFYAINDKDELLNRISLFLHSRRLDEEVSLLRAIVNKKMTNSIDVINDTLNRGRMYVQLRWSVAPGYEDTYGRVLIQITDITNYHHLEKAIQKLESRYTAIFQSANMGIAIIDKRFRFMEVNDALINMSGFVRESLVKMKLTELFYLKNASITIRLMEGVFSGKRDNFQREVKVLCREEKIVWWKLTFSIIKDGDAEASHAVAIIEDVTEEREIKEEKNKYLEQLEETEKRLKRTSKNLINIQETERGFISRELHDEIGQLLSAIKVEMTHVINQNCSEIVNEHMQEGKQIVDFMINRVRDMSMNLRPSIIDDFGMIPAINWYIKKQSQRNDLTVELKAKMESKKLNPDVEITCYRIVQEAITNVIRHAQTNQVWVNIYEKKNDIYLKIVDNGIGFDVQKIVDRSLDGVNVGILGMMDRVKLIGGKFSITSSPEKRKTTITAHIPKTI